MTLDPGRIPFKQLLEDSHRVERESEAKAQMHTRLYPGNDDDASPARGVRGALDRLRDTLRRRH